MSKKIQRSNLKATLVAMPEESKRLASEAICERLRSIASVSSADTIFAYLPLEDEVNLLPLVATWLDESRTIGVPLVSWEEKTMKAGMLTTLEDAALKLTRHGLLEPCERHPIPAGYIDVILVPGVGFDATGGRLGRGGGFYDRYLCDAHPPIVIGVAFDEQIVNSIHVEPHDQRMSAVVTQSRTLLN